MIDKIKGHAEVEKECMDVVSAYRAVVSVIEPALCNVDDVSFSKCPT